MDCPFPFGNRHHAHLFIIEKNYLMSLLFLPDKRDEAGLILSNINDVATV